MPIAFDLGHLVYVPVAPSFCLIFVGFSRKYGEKKVNLGGAQQACVNKRESGISR